MTANKKIKKESINSGVMITIVLNGRKQRVFNLICPEIGRH
jgi:hypothetical protein